MFKRYIKGGVNDVKDDMKKQKQFFLTIMSKLLQLYVLYDLFLLIKTMFIEKMLYSEYVSYYSRLLVFCENIFLSLRKLEKRKRSRFTKLSNFEFDLAFKDILSRIELLYEYSQQNRLIFTS